MIPAQRRNRRDGLRGTKRRFGQTTSGWNMVAACACTNAAGPDHTSTPRVKADWPCRNPERGRRPGEDGISYKPDYNVGYEPALRTKLAVVKPHGLESSSR